MNGKSSRYDKLENMLQDGLCSEPHNLPLKYLRDITNNFSDERLLGEGGFGTVYKGVLQNGETIAVKKLHSSIPGVKGRHFENEANHLMRLKHPNVVLLVGWCFENEKTYTEYNGKYIWAEKPERLLCLEYMPKGNLRAYLSDEFSGLGWDTRYKIIEGICYGLHYLHKEWQLNARIVHMDLKPANILLDNNMVPKIADFGLSRLFSEEKTWTCTISRDGTLGYMSPEYINKGLVSTKSDVFSLGVIIIEIVTGHRDYPDETGTSSEKFIEMVLNNWSQRNRVENLFGHVSLEVEYQQIRKCIQIGLDCVKIDRFKRLTISQIIKTLHGLASADSSNIKGVHRSEAKMRPFEREETTIGGSLTDELLPVFSQSNSVASNGAAEEAVTAAAVGEDLMSQAAGGNAPPSPFFAAGDSLLDELQLQEQLAFLNDDCHYQLPLFTSECRSPGAGPGDTYEATKVVFSRIQELDPDHAAKIMGFLLIQGHGEKEMIRLAFGPDALLHTVMAKARKDLGLLPAPGSGLGTPTSVTSAAAVHSPFLLSRQNSGRCGGGGAGTAPSPLSVSSPSSWAPPPVFSRSNSVVSNGVAAGSRQIYLTFPADSTFREEDVSNYFSIYGPVHDVRIPYQQKRMFGFITFVYPETVKLILAKGNPHFICDARVLVKPYKEKGKVPDKYRKQQLQGERVDFSNGLAARDHFDLHQLGARMLQHSHSANEMLLRRKQQQQQAMELQSRRLMGLQLLDLKPRSSPSPIGMPFSPTRAVESPPDSAGEQGKGSGGFLLPQRRAVNGGDKEESAGDASPNADSDQSAEHNLPDSPFASPTKKSAAAAYSRGPSAPSDSEIPAAAAASPGRNAAPFAGINNGGLTGHRRPSVLDIPSPKPYFFPMSRLSSDHGAGAIGMLNGREYDTTA